VPGGDPPHGIDQVLGAGVLGQEPGHVRGQRPAQVPRLAQHGQDQYPAVRALLVQLRRGGQAVRAGQVDVDHRHIRLNGHRRRHDAATVGDLGDHVDVGFQAEQRDQRVPQDLHVLGDQNADHGPLPNLCYRASSQCQRSAVAS